MNLTLNKKTAEEESLKCTLSISISREALEKYHAFRQRCNSFFMDVVSQLCFAHGSPPNIEVVERLLRYVTRESEVASSTEIKTKQLTAFQGDGVDSTPVIRSVLLQLLLQAK